MLDPLGDDFTDGAGDGWLIGDDSDGATGEGLDGGGDIEEFVTISPATNGNGAKTGNPNLTVDWQAPLANNKKGGKSGK